MDPTQHPVGRRMINRARLIAPLAALLGMPHHIPDASECEEAIRIDRKHRETLRPWMAANRRHRHKSRQSRGKWQPPSRSRWNRGIAETGTPYPVKRRRAAVLGPHR